MLTLGSRLMEYVQSEGLLREEMKDPRKEWPWGPDAEAKINEFLRKHLEGKIFDLSIVDGILETKPTKENEHA